MKGFRDPIVTTSCDHVIIRFIFPFSISKEILFSRFNCAFFSSNFPFLAFFSKSRRSSLRLLLLRSFPDRLCEGGRSIENHGWSFLPSKHNLELCARHGEHGGDGGHRQGGVQQRAVAPAGGVSHRFAEQGDAFISFRINVLSLNPEEDDGRLRRDLQKLGQPFLPDKLRLFLHSDKRHEPSLNWRCVLIHLVAPPSEALLHPESVDHPSSNMTKIQTLASREDRLVHRRHVLHLWIDLPSQLSSVADSNRQALRVAYFHLSGLEERPILLFCQCLDESS